MSRFIWFYSCLLVFLLGNGCGLQVSSGNSQQKPDSPSSFSYWEGTYKGYLKAVDSKKKNYPSRISFQRFSHKAKLFISHPYLHNQTWIVEAPISKFSSKSTYLYAKITGTAYWCDFQAQLDGIDMTGTMKIYIRYGLELKLQESFTMSFSKENS